MRGMSTRPSAMPMMPTKTPGTIMFHTMVMTIPRPRMSALATPTSTVATALPLSAMGPSSSIFLRTRTITSKMAHPTAPTATPGAKAPPFRDEAHAHAESEHETADGPQHK